MENLGLPEPQSWLLRDLAAVGTQEREIGQSKTGLPRSFTLVAGGKRFELLSQAPEAYHCGNGVLVTS